MKRYKKLTEAKKYTNPYMTNRKMNKETYGLRKQVMQYIYRAKKLLQKKGVEMPRVNVRITDVDVDEFKKAKTSALGQAGIKGLHPDVIIWIPASTISSGYNLQSIVYHEILHTAFGVDHNNSDPLMKPNISVKEHPSPSALDKMFLNNIKMGML